jgi:carboxypeptidase family protein
MRLGFSAVPNSLSPYLVATIAEISWKGTSGQTASPAKISVEKLMGLAVEPLKGFPRGGGGGVSVRNLQTYPTRSGESWGGVIMRVCKCASLIVLLAGLVAVAARPALAQINTANLSGHVLDPKELAVPGAKVTVENLATGASRSTDSDAAGVYNFVGLTPGRYKLTVEAKSFAKLVNPELVLTIGQAAEFDATLQIAGTEQTVTVTGATELIETSRTAVANTVDLREITNLPINGRNYINFTLLDSRAQRDDAPSIGAAPTSGINFAGQRARSNEVSVDGADAVDNSVNGIRSTVSQEAVQEFQIIDSNYMPEFGRAAGGVVNIVTKSGSNELHGNAFGYLRQKDIQARNPFSVQVDPSTGNLIGVKQAFTRVQAGATLGGPIQKDKTFYFFSFETTRRQETGFTNIGANNFGFAPATLLCFPTPLQMTLAQGQFYQAAINAATGGNPANCTSAAVAPLLQAAAITGASSTVSTAGNLGSVGPFLGLPANGPFFPLPIDCTPGVNCTAANVVPLPASYVGLNSLRGNYPIKEKTSSWSARLDHIWNPRNSTFVRFSVTPSFVTGIQVNAQNQNFGQNAGSRTSLQRFLDNTLVAQHVSSLTPTVFNEARFQFARRGLHYGFSQLPGGDQAAVNITGFAFFGREPFSTVDRIERRFQWTDNVTVIHGNHTFKTGVDTNLVQIRSKIAQVFELNFGGLFNFGALSSSFLGPGLPDFTAVQAYGLGLPTVFIQGIGHSNRPFNNIPVGAFWQDSWKIVPRLTLNYGVRYDIELTPTFRPGTQLNQIAEPALGVLEGIPVDRNNVSPRFALAWDPTGSGKTVVRAGYGIFFDHPLLAVAFDSTTAEGALSSQLVSGGGVPTGVAVTPATAATAINGASIFQGVLGGNPILTPGSCGPNIPASFGYLCSQQRFNATLDGSIFTNQNFITQGFPLPILPFTLPTAKNFVYAYAQQANLTVEREFVRDFKVGLSYTYTHGLHENRPRNINTSNPVLLTTNFQNAIASGLSPSSPLTVAVPTGSGCVNTPTGSLFLIAPGALAQGFAAQNCPGASLVGFVSTPAFFNFFRPSGPNPSFQALVTGGYATEVALAAAAGYPVGIPNVQVPYSDVLQQESSGDSVYHGLTLSVSKRFSHHIEFLSGYTWSHAIDNSTDLQTLLAPQDNRFPNRERSNSTFDQRHRWITSAVMDSPFKRTDEGFLRKFLADFTLAPIVEVASGRPFTVLTGTDFNLDFGSNTDRPSVVPVGTPGSVTSPFIHNVAFSVPTVCDAGVPVAVRPLGCTGNLGRNAFVRPGFFTFDLRLSRKIFFGERTNLEIIADAFNLFNRFNVGDVNPLCDPTNASACQPGQPSAALDPRQFQFALKVNW